MKRALALAAAALLAACVSPEGLRPGARQLDAGALGSRDSLAVTAPASWPGGQWWRAYGDAQLDGLMAAALEGSPTLAAARARIEKAVALADAAGAAQRPQVRASAGADRQRIAEHGIFPKPLAGASLTMGSLGLGLDYEFDFWGRHHAALEAALSRARVAAIEAEAAKLALTVAIAASYVELEHQYALVDVGEATLKQREQIRALTARRIAAGLDTEVEIHQSASAVYAMKAELAAASERITLLGNALAALSGRGPDHGLTITRPRLGAGHAAALPERLPAELLGRRPDLVAQRLRVEAAAGDIKVAQARFYPNINLTALLGLQAAGLEHLLNGSNRVFEATAAVSLPIFDGGRLRANLAASDADYDLAVEQYNATLVESLREVADQVGSWRAIERQDVEQRQAQTEAEHAQRLALLRYRGGLASYLSVLAGESAVLAQQRLAADLRARRLLAAIGLTRALGGGFQDGAAGTTP